MENPVIRFTVSEKVYDSGITGDEFVVTMLHTGVDDSGQWWTWLRSRRLNRLTGQYGVDEAGGYQKTAPQSDIGRHVTVDLKALETWYRTNVQDQWVNVYRGDQFIIDGINSWGGKAEYHILQGSYCIGCPCEFVTFNDGLPSISG